MSELAWNVAVTTVTGPETFRTAQAYLSDFGQLPRTVCWNLLVLRVADSNRRDISDADHSRHLCKYLTTSRLLIA